MSQEKKYVIWSNEHQAWWRASQHGYTRWLEDAGRYGEIEAKEICESGYLGKPYENRKAEFMLIAPESMEGR